MKLPRYQLLVAVLTLGLSPAGADVRWDGVFLETHFANTFKVGDNVTNTPAVALASGGNVAHYPGPNGQLPAASYLENGQTRFIQLRQSVIGHAVAVTPGVVSAMLTKARADLQDAVAYTSFAHETANHDRAVGQPWNIRFPGVVDPGNTNNSGFSYTNATFHTNLTHEAANYYRAVLRAAPLNLAAAHGLLRTYYERMAAYTFAGHNGAERAARVRLLYGDINLEISNLENYTLNFYTNATDELNLLTSRPLEAQLFDGSYPHISPSVLASNRNRLTEAYTRALTHQGETIFKIGQLNQFKNYGNPLINSTVVATFTNLVAELAARRNAVAERQLLLDVSPELTPVGLTELGRARQLLDQIQSLESSIENGRIVFVASRPRPNPLFPAEVWFEEFSPTYVPFLKMENDNRPSYRQLIGIARDFAQAASAVEVTAAQWVREFDVNLSVQREKLSEITNRYYAELGALCGWIRADGGPAVPDVILALFPLEERTSLHSYAGSDESLGEIGSQWTRIAQAQAELELAEQDLESIYSQMAKKSEVAGEIAAGIDNLARMYLENGEKLEGLDIQAGKLQADAAIDRAKALQSNGFWSGLKKGLAVAAGVVAGAYTAGAAAPLASGAMWGGAAAGGVLGASDAVEGNGKSMKIARIEARLAQNLANINAQRTRIATLEKVAVQNQQRDQLLLQTEEALHALLLQAERQKLTILLAEQRVGSEFLALQNLIGRVQFLLREYANALELRKQDPLASPDYRLIRDLAVREAEDAFVMAHRWAFLAARSVEYRFNVSGSGGIDAVSQSVLASRRGSQLTTTLNSLESTIATYFLGAGQPGNPRASQSLSIRHHLAQRNLIALGAELLPDGGRVDTILTAELQPDGVTSAAHWLAFLQSCVKPDPLNPQSSMLEIDFATDFGTWPVRANTTNIINPLYELNTFMRLIGSVNQAGSLSGRGVEVQITGRNLSLGSQIVSFSLEQRGISQVRVMAACQDPNAIRYWELRKPERLPYNLQNLLGGRFYSAFGDAGVNRWEADYVTQLDEFSPANSLWRLKFFGSSGGGGNQYLLNNLDKIEDIKIRFWTREFATSCP